ncbi:MAG: AAA family ATPase [Lachnospiraceae bacterium]|nr:AAA family ATPase [Lachnospiraceae bacterium]
MIINSIYIENYGGLSNFKMDFSDGLNVINEHNGYGKSTINSFIKAMFYGLPNSTKRDIDLNEYNHYAPLDGGIFGGSLIFTTDDKTYRIERIFDKTKSEKAKKDTGNITGTFKLYDNKTNMPSDDYSTNIGFELFGVDESTYVTTVYAGQGKVNSPLGNTLLNKLKNAANEDENSEDEYTSAYAVLDAKRGEYHKQSGAGLMDDIQRTIDDNNLFISNSVEYKAKVIQRQKEIEALSEQVKKNDEMRKAYNEEIKKAEKNSVNKANKEKKDNLDKKYADIQKELNTLDDYFSNGIPEDEELDQILEKIANLDGLRKAEFKAGDFESDYKELCDQMERNNITRESIDACRDKIKEIKEEEKIIDSLEMDVKEESEKLYDIDKPNTTMLLVLGVILIIAGLVAAGVIYVLTGNVIYALLGLIISLTSIIFFILISGKNKEYEREKARQQARVEEKEKKLNDKKIECEGKRQSLNLFLGKFLKINNDIESLLLNMEVVLNEKDKYNDRLKKIEEDKAENAAKADSLEKEIISCIQKYEPYTREGNNYKEIIKLIRDKSNKIKMLNKSFEDVQNDLKLIPESDYVIEEGVRSIEELQKLDGEIHDETISVMNQINIYKNDIEEYNDILSEAERKAEENEDLKAELKEAKNTFNLIKKTMDLLKKAKENFSSRYINEINANMTKYIDMIDDNEGRKFVVDANFNIRDCSGAISRDFKYSSVGIRELVMVSLRFALIDTLFKEEYPTIVWDDPFVNLDDDNLQRGMNLLKRISESKQIIYFTCSKSRA